MEAVRPLKPSSQQERLSPGRVLEAREPQLDKSWSTAVINSRREHEFLLSCHQLQVPAITAELEIMYLCTRPRLLPYDDLYDWRCPPQTFPFALPCHVKFFCFLIHQGQDLRQSLQGLQYI